MKTGGKPVHNTEPDQDGLVTLGADAYTTMLLLQARTHVRRQTARRVPAGKADAERPKSVPTQSVGTTEGLLFYFTPETQQSRVLFGERNA